jgi:hypothetical protein
MMVTYAKTQNDLDVVGTKVLPNSELTFQILGKEEAANLKYIWHHPIANQGTIKMIKEAHESKQLPLDQVATWTPADGDVFYKLLGTRNGRPAVFMSADHPGVMRCRGVTKIHTTGQISKDKPGVDLASMIMELGNLPNCG